MILQFSVGDFVRIVQQKRKHFTNTSDRTYEVLEVKQLLSGQSLRLKDFEQEWIFAYYMELGSKAPTRCFNLDEAEA